MDEDELILEPTLDAETAPAMETAAVLNAAGTVTAAPSRYWQAQGLADTLRREFDRAQQTGDRAAVRDAFSPLAVYYGRTLAILRSALTRRREPLIQAVLHNLIALHQTLAYMHGAAPELVPSTLAFNRELRQRLLEDLIVRVLQDAGEALAAAAITERVNAIDLLADVTMTRVSTHLENLRATGHVEQQSALYQRSARPYSGVNLDRAALQMLLSPELLPDFEAAGFRGLTDVMARKGEFRGLFSAATATGEGTAALFVAAAEFLIEAPVEMRELSPWRHADLINSPYPRPYQHDAYAIFRGYGYAGQVIEAPTGSGKTLIGMLCIQDWLRSLSPGQSILVLVPTVNYQQQWVGELCYKPVGLKLSPHLVFTGTPASLATARERAGIAPAVIVMTYTALSQTGSALGKGGFDQDSIESFLQGNNVQYVVLDEVHKVVEDMRSLAAGVTRVMTEWLRDGAITGLIGFSGTATAYRGRFAELGLDLVYSMPAAELIAYGFVAPFAEYGVCFAYSDRERQIRNLLDSYKAQLRSLITLLGSGELRRQFAEIPLDERIVIGRDLLRMYAGRADQTEALAKRCTVWERGGELLFSELQLITIIQIARGWSDQQLVQTLSSGNPSDTTVQTAYEELQHTIDGLRRELATLVYLPDAIRRLSVEGFGTVLQAEALRHVMSEVTSVAARTERVKDYLATTMVGLYGSISDWYLRVGEGRVASIKAIIEAERATRPVHGVIVFDAGTRIRWQGGVATPGYAGVAGVFAEMLGDERFTPLAALSSELYMAYNEADPLPQRIARFIERSIMGDELGESLFGLATQGLDLPEPQLLTLRQSFEELLGRYLEELRDVHAARPGEFGRQVLAPLRRTVRKLKLGSIGDSLRARLSLRQYHIRDWSSTFFDYALIANGFRQAHVAELEQVSGARRKFFVVKMADGDRKQLMYDLTARIVDSEELPVNMIIVSPWARTGWNVIKPNLLIDATATRDVTAWQQLRGRAMRAMRTWTNDCYRLMLMLLGSRPAQASDMDGLPEDVVASFAEVRSKPPQVGTTLDTVARAILLDVHERSMADRQQARDSMDGIETLAKLERGALAELTRGEREQLVTELMLARNKVTHIYELVKAYGTTSQIRYDRQNRRWLRTDAIAAKHAREYAVSPLSGEYTAGPEHAPLLYASDPRNDVPSELEHYVAGQIKDRDPLIVGGWITIITAGSDEEEQLDVAD